MLSTFPEMCDFFTNSNTFSQIFEFIPNKSANFFLRKFRILFPLKKFFAHKFLIPRFLTFSQEFVTSSFGFKFGICSSTLAQLLSFLLSIALKHHSIVTVLYKNNLHSFVSLNHSCENNFYKGKLMFFSTLFRGVYPHLQTLPPLMVWKYRNLTNSLPEQQWHIGVNKQFS